MTNYKHQKIEFFWNSFITKTEKNIQIKTLTAPLASATETLHYMRNNTNYQVPTGKLARVIYLQQVTNMGLASADYLAYTDNLDGLTNFQKIIHEPGNLNSGNPSVFHGEEIPSGKYITKKATNTADEIEIKIAEYDV